MLLIKLTLAVLATILFLVTSVVFVAIAASFFLAFAAFWIILVGLVCLAPSMKSEGGITKVDG
jgi:hypothetical protein